MALARMWIALCYVSGAARGAAAVASWQPARQAGVPMTIHVAYDGLPPRRAAPRGARSTGPRGLFFLSPSIRAVGGNLNVDSARRGSRGVAAGRPRRKPATRRRISRAPQEETERPRSAGGAAPATQERDSGPSRGRPVSFQRQGASGSLDCAPWQAAPRRSLLAREEKGPPAPRAVAFPYCFFPLEPRRSALPLRSFLFPPFSKLRAAGVAARRPSRLPPRGPPGLLGRVAPRSSFLLLSQIVVGPFVLPATPRPSFPPPTSAARDRPTVGARSAASGERRGRARLI